MKKLALLITLCLFGFSATAQGLDFGIKAGVNFSNITDATGLDNRTGFVAGVFIGGKFNDNLGIQADVLYSQQGAEFELGNFDLNYVNVPIVLKYYVSGGLNLQLGPQFGVLLDQETNVVSETIDDIATNDFDLSAVLGLGYDLPMGIRIDGRYSFGLSDVPDDPAKGLDKGKNSVITLSLGYSFL
jgi:hypothetical protein